MSVVIEFGILLRGHRYAKTVFSYFLFDFVLIVGFHSFSDLFKWVFFPPEIEYEISCRGFRIFNFESVVFDWLC